MSSIEKALGSLAPPLAAQTEAEGKKIYSKQNNSEKNGTAIDANDGPSIAAPTASADANEPNRPSAEHGNKRVINIPFDVLQAAGYIIPTMPRSMIAEEFRAIKRPLLKNITGQSASPIQNANLIMVTSALEGDGKTFSSLNLAMSIAMEQDKTVLFVDADVVKATAGAVLGIAHNTAGLTDVLVNDGMDLKDVILRTNIDKFSVLPAGVPHERATELLASRSMQELMLEISARYHDRVIIFDSPPLLMTTESAVLASFMGQIVFVAAAHVTPQHAVRDALEHIGDDKMVAVLLNKVPRRRFKFFGIGQGYGYGYNYGYSQGRHDNATSAQQEAQLR